MTIPEGFPSSNGHIPFECATIAEVLGERGWKTRASATTWPSRSRSGSRS